MGQGLAEKEKIKNTFGKFVDPEIANQILKDEIKLGGEIKNVAIFFSDIRSFTAISEKLQPNEVVEFLNEYMTKMVDCITKTKGIVNKFIGDAIMAIWGAPLSHGNDTENAINASLMMRKALHAYNKNRGGDKKPIIQIGCGINTGPALAGQIGSHDRMEYTVIGDAVNLASRVESLNKPFGTDILITIESYELVKDIFHVAPMQKIKVKGKVEPQQIYAVLGRLDDPNRIKTLEELREYNGVKNFVEKPVDTDKEEVKYEIMDSDSKKK
jgi:adenylate cyclase